MSQNKNSCIHEGQNNAHVTNSITGDLTYHMRYYMNNYGEKKLVFWQFFILRVLRFSSVSLSPHKAPYSFNLPPTLHCLHADSVTE